MIQPLSYNRPTSFFLGSLLITSIVQFFAAYISYYMQSLSFLIFPLILVGMSGPSIMALVLLVTTKNENLWNDFCQRLRFNKIKMYFIPLVMIFWPCLILLAIALSLLFGLSTDQFLPFQGSLDPALGNAFLGLCLIVFLSCSLEEIGWRGYGIESLNSKYNLLYTSLIFTILWSLWHVPAFFIKDGFFQQALWNAGILQVITYFISYFPVTILMNWIYVKNNRSIIIVILFHAIMNISYGFFPIQPFTKIILMVLLLLTAGIILIKDKRYFFSKPQVFN